MVKEGETHLVACQRKEDRVENNDVNKKASCDQERLLASGHCEQIQELIQRCLSQDFCENPAATQVCNDGPPSSETPSQPALREGLKKDFRETESRIARCAELYGWKFFSMPAAELKILEQFLLTHLNPEIQEEYRRKVRKVKAIFQREFTAVEHFLEEVEKLAQDFPPPLASSELPIPTPLDPFKTRLIVMAQILETLENPDLVPEQLEHLFTILRKIFHQGHCQSADAENLRTSTHQMQGLLRYMIEAQEETYLSGRFSAEYFAQVLGFAKIEDLFFREDGSRRTIVDLGCGDGDLLLELAREYRRWVRGISIASSIETWLSELGYEVTFSFGYIKEAFYVDFISKLRQIGFSFPQYHEPIDPQLIGVDQTRSFPMHLRSPEHGISGRRGDICAPFEAFQKQTGIKEGSVDVVTTTLTLDRAYAVENLFINMATMLRKDGRFMIATKGLIKSQSDGQGGRKHQIQYGGKTLTSNTYAGTLKKLARELKKQGLEIETLSCHPCLVSSSDCYPDQDHQESPISFSFDKETGNKQDLANPVSRQKYGPQEYQLMIIAGKKSAETSGNSSV